MKVDTFCVDVETRLLCIHGRTHSLISRIGETKENVFFTFSANLEYSEQIERVLGVNKYELVYRRLTPENIDQLRVYNIQYIFIGLSKMSFRALSCHFYVSS